MARLVVRRALFGLFALAAFPAAASEAVLIHDVTLISPERKAPLVHADVLLRDGRIAKIGTNLTAAARRIDGQGRFLIPGLIDSHVHVGHSAALDDDAIDAHPDLWAAYRAQVPRAYLAFGFTTLVDLDLKPRDRTWFEATPLHPRFHGCGQGVKVAGGYGAFKPPKLGSPSFPNLVYERAEPKSWPQGLDPADYTAQAAVSRTAATGAICVKAFVETGFGQFHWPTLHTETLRAVRDAAKTRGLPLFVHANGVESWRIALDAKADVIAHGLWIWPGEDAGLSNEARAAIDRAAASPVRVQPTLQVIEGERAIFDPAVLDDPRMGVALPKAVLAYLRTPEAEKARLAMAADYRGSVTGFDALFARTRMRIAAGFKRMLEKHVALIFGSDTPAGDGFGNPPGLNGRFEIQDWFDNGAPLALILSAATLDNAKALGLARELGSIEEGKRADLLLLAKDPLTDVSAYDAIETVILDGEPIARESLAPQD